MKKILSVFMLGGVSLSANAQQINGGFDAEWVKCVPWDSKGNTSVSGTEPEGWHASNVNTAIGKKQIIDAVEGKDGTGKAAHLYNTSIAGNKIPAYLTLGTPFATAEVRGITVKNSDGGTFGGSSFTFRPDAMRFDYKRDNSNGDENATVIAYLWNGTWTQKDVPGNTVVWASAKKVDMQDRDRNILDMATATGGEVTSTEGAKCVAKIEKSIEGSTNGEWASDTINFVYADKNASVEKLNVIFSATDYFGDRNNIVDGNSLTIDNVEFVYYHALTALSTTDSEGNAVKLNEPFATDRYNYTVNAAYDENKTKVAYTKKGVGAKVEQSYDESTCVLTVSVKGDDYDAETNPSSVTTYTIKYKKPAPTLNSLVVAGHEFIAVGNDSKNFTATGNYYADELQYAASSEAAHVSADYDKAAGKLTLTVEEEGTVAPNVYTVTFEGKEKEPVYQIPNSDFENWGETALAEGWNSFESAAGTFTSFASMSPMPEKIEGVEGNGVRLKSKDLWVAYANGNMTTGRINMGSANAADAANYNFTDRTDVNANLPFAGEPDAFEVYARFTPGTAKEEGTELQGRVQIIMHGDAAYHDPELSEFDADKIASASVLIPATAEWTKFTGEFSYTGNESDKRYLLASATTNPVPGASKDDQLDLDNLKLVYYHALKNLTFDGAQIEGFSSDKLNYTVEIEGSAEEAAKKIGYEVKGKGAIVTTVLNDNELAINVIGNDYLENENSFTTYTVTLKQKVVDAIDSISADNAKNHKVYTLGGVRVSGKPAAGVYVVDGKKTAIK